MRTRWSTPDAATLVRRSGRPAFRHPHRRDLRALASVTPRRGSLVLLALVVVVLAGPVPTAQAHAFLSSSIPADGQSLAVAPTELRLAFSEPVVLSATRIDVVDGAGTHIWPTGLRVETRTGPAGVKAPVDVVVGLPTLVSSTYRILWETLSADDLHRTTGVIVFGVGQHVAASGLAEPPPPPMEAGLRWLLLLGLSCALGGLLAVRLLEPVVGPEASSAATYAARRIAASGAIAATGVAIILLFNQLIAAGATAAGLLWGNYGLRWGIREIGLVLLVVAATSHRGSTTALRGRRGMVVLGAALACVGTALLGHSASGAATNVTRVVASAAHLGAAATWAGAVIVLAVVVLPRPHRAAARPESTRSGLDPASTRTVLQRFGPPAAGCVAVMVVTGIYLSSKVVGSVDAALFTIYGRTLLAKLVLVGAAGALALVNTLRLHRRGRRPAPRRTVMAEAVAAVGILVLAAALTSGQPAMEPQLVQQPTAQTDGPLDRAVVDLQEAVDISPNQPGPNVILVDVFDTRRPAPGPIRGVLITLTGADGSTGEPMPAEPLTDGRWSVRTTLADPGSMTVQVDVQRDGLTVTPATYSWTVGGAPDQTRPAVISTTPAAPVLVGIAQVLLAVLLVVGLALALSRAGGPLALFAALSARRGRRRAARVMHALP
ncbi:MAG: copper resistance CopC/CopD family protein [Cellulomonas sp.]